MSAARASIMALDLGTKMGWARQYAPVPYDDQAAIMKGVTFTRPVAFGKCNWSANRFKGGGMRYLQFEQWLEKQHEDHPVEQLHFEEVRAHNGVDAAHVYGGLLAILTAWCERRSVPYLGHSVGTIKMFATGNGGASKAAMIAAAKKCGFDVTTDDEADAIHVLMLARSGLSAAEIRRNKKKRHRPRIIVDRFAEFM